MPLPRTRVNWKRNYEALLRLFRPLLAPRFGGEEHVSVAFGPVFEFPVLIEMHNGEGWVEVGGTRGPTSFWWRNALDSFGGEEQPPLRVRVTVFTPWGGRLRKEVEYRRTDDILQ